MSQWGCLLGAAVQHACLLSARRQRRANRGAMLSHDDRRRLKTIERQLISDDPHLAECFDRWPPSRASRRAAFFVPLTMVLGAVGTLAGIILWSLPVFLVFLAVLLVGSAWMVRRPGRRRATP